MNEFKYCCLLVAGWLGTSGTNGYRHSDEGRGPDYIISLLNELKRRQVLIVTKKSDALASNLPIFELHVESQFSRLKRVPRFLLLLEEKHIRPQNYVISQKNYKTIYSWDPDIVSKFQGRKFRFPSYFSSPPVGDYSQRDVLLTMISANKGQTIGTKFDLYKERRRIIDWYETRDIDSFEYYGPGWELPNHPNGVLAKIIFKKFNKIIYNQTHKRKNWKGVASSKLSVLKKSKFNLCFENYRGARGYVTEKIFDAFSCGCVPIYYGAPDIKDHVPPQCFINYRDFNNINDLHQFISSMSAERYTLMQQEIFSFFINSSTIASIDTFVDGICDDLLSKVHVNYS